MANRLKIVHDAGMVARLWADQSQEEARNPQGNFYFNGKTIYSYGSHFPIAVHHKSKKQGDIILFTTRTYSSTTSGHIWDVRRVVDDSKVIFCKHPDDAVYNNHTANIKQWIYEIDTNLDKWAAAKKPDSYKHKIQEIKNELETYCQVLNVKLTRQEKSLIDESKFPARLALKRAYYLAGVQEKKEANKEHRARVREGKVIYQRYWQAWNELQPMEFTDTELEKMQLYEIELPKQRTDIKLRINGNVVETSKGGSMSCQDFLDSYDIYSWFIQNAKLVNNKHCPQEVVEFFNKQTSSFNEKEICIDGRYKSYYYITHKELLSVVEKLNQLKIAA